jgi:hypothetical protein
MAKGMRFIDWICSSRSAFSCWAGHKPGFCRLDLLRGMFLAGDPLYQAKRLRSFECQRKAETMMATPLFTSLKHVYALQNSFITQIRNVGM